MHFLYSDQIQQQEHQVLEQTCWGTSHFYRWEATLNQFLEVCFSLDQKWEMGGFPFSASSGSK